MKKIAATLKKNITLGEHQQRVVDKLKKTDSLLLYHNLGSGKTLSSMAGASGEISVITPASLRMNYSQELSKFLKDVKGFDIKSYEQANKLPIAGDTLVVDEVHRIGNQQSKRSKRIRSLSKGYGKRIALSGSPILNHPHELAPIIKLLNPDDETVPLARGDFNKKFLVKKTPLLNALSEAIFGIGIGPGQVTKVKNEEVLKKALKGRVDYHNNVDPLTYPEVIEKDVVVDLSKEHTDMYHCIVNEVSPLIARKVRMNVTLNSEELKKAKAYMNSARQASNTTAKFGKNVPSNKLIRIAEDAASMKKDDKNFKGVVYSNYLQSGVDELDKEFKTRGLKYTQYTGKMNEKQKAEAISEYNKGKVDGLIVTSAGTEGLNLKGTKLMQITEPHWNQSKINQVIGRGVRFGSHLHLPEAERKVLVNHYLGQPKRRWYNLKKPTGADEYLKSLSKKKQEVIDKFLKILQEEGSE